MARSPDGVNWPCVPNNMSARVPTAARTAFTIAAERSMSVSSGWCGPYCVYGPAGSNFTAVNPCSTQWTAFCAARSGSL